MYSLTIFSILKFSGVLSDRKMEQPKVKYKFLHTNVTMNFTLVATR